ncbi:DUF6624 domain-containing protein [Spirillospora sp. NPDC048911]|uniref:DUF6624 domain-containing protein n=1 Tax=Spirillospora sp. NPDC048911 TaxID=3364527 RepID=UPI00371ECBBC
MPSSTSHHPVTGDIRPVHGGQYRSAGQDHFVPSRHFQNFAGECARVTDPLQGVSGPSLCVNGRRGRPIDSVLREELLRRMELDQDLRLSAPRNEPMSAELVRQWLELNADNLAYLKQVIEKHGWPGRDLVGDDGAHAAWILAQHADRDRAFQRRCLTLLTAAVEAGQAAARDLAYLTDRCRVAEGRPQVYGTQYNPDGPAPIEDPDGLDARRAQAGLGPHAEYDRAIRAEMESSDQ